MIESGVGMTRMEGVQIHAHLTTKQQPKPKNHMGRRKAAKKSKQPREAMAATARVGHHGQAMVASGWGSSLPKRCIFTPPCSTGFAFVGSFLATFVIFFDPLGA